ncbi:MAG TPA: hypothetical protein VF209_04665 [Patescibacteria group bacterium]
MAEETRGNKQSLPTTSMPRTAENFQFGYEKSHSFSPQPERVTNFYDFVRFIQDLTSTTENELKKVEQVVNLGKLDISDKKVFDEISQKYENLYLLVRALKSKLRHLKEGFITERSRNRAEKMTSHKLDKAMITILETVDVFHQAYQDGLKIHDQILADIDDYRQETAGKPVAERRDYKYLKIASQLVLLASIVTAAYESLSNVSSAEAANDTDTTTQDRFVDQEGDDEDVTWDQFTMEEWQAISNIRARLEAQGYHPNPEVSRYFAQRILTGEGSVEEFTNLLEDINGLNVSLEVPNYAGEQLLTLSLPTGVNYEAFIGGRFVPYKDIDGSIPRDYQYVVNLSDEILRAIPHDSVTFRGNVPVVIIQGVACIAISDKLKPNGPEDIIFVEADLFADQVTEEMMVGPVVATTSPETVTNPSATTMAERVKDRFMGLFGRSRTEDTATRPHNNFTPDEGNEGAGFASNESGEEENLNQQELEFINNLGIVFVTPDGHEYPQDYTIGSLGVAHEIPRELILQGMAVLEQAGLPQDVRTELVLPINIDPNSFGEEIARLVSEGVNHNTVALRLAENVEVYDAATNVNTTYTKGTIIFITNVPVIENQRDVLAAYLPIEDIQEMLVEWAGIPAEIAHSDRVGTTINEEERTIVVLVDGKPRMLLNTDALFKTLGFGPGTFVVLTPEQSQAMSTNLWLVRNQNNEIVSVATQEAPTNSNSQGEIREIAVVQSEGEPLRINESVSPPEASGAPLFMEAEPVLASFGLSVYPESIQDDIEREILAGNIKYHPELKVLVTREGRIISETVLPELREDESYDSRYSAVTSENEFEASKVDIHDDITITLPSGKSIRFIWAYNDQFAPDIELNAAGEERFRQAVLAHAADFEKHAGKTILIISPSAILDLDQAQNPNANIYRWDGPNRDARSGVKFINLDDQVILVSGFSFSSNANELFQVGASLGMLTDTLIALRSNLDLREFGNDPEKVIALGESYDRLNYSYTIQPNDPNDLSFDLNQ